jgi:putative ABC transport system permease protein
MVDYRRVTPGTLEMLGIPIISGRSLSWSDYDRPERLVAVVDERFATEMWPDRSPLGLHFTVPRRAYGERVTDVMTEVEVVGVAAPIRGRTLRLADPPSIYITTHFNPAGDFTLLAPGRGGSTPPPDALRAAVARADPELPIFDYATMEEVRLRDLESVRYALLLLALLGGVGLTPAAIGVFGLLSFDLGLRRRELAVRAALGATPRGLLGLVLRDAAVVAGAGLAVGLLGTLALARMLAALLYEARTSDPVVLTGVATTLAQVALTAGWGPARRAGRSDPAESLREYR